MEFDGFAIELNRADLKVDANCTDVAFCVRVVSEPKKQARLADAGVANEQELEKVIAVKGGTTVSLCRSMFFSDKVRGGLNVRVTTQMRGHEKK